MTKRQLKDLILECLNEIDNIDENIITQIRGHDIEEVAEEMKRAIEDFCMFEMTPLYKINNVDRLFFAKEKFFRDMENQVQIVLNNKNLSNIQFQIDYLKDNRNGQLRPKGERKYVLNLSINYFLIHNTIDSKLKNFNDIDFSRIRETLVHELMHAEQFERITTKAKMVGTKGRIRKNTTSDNSYFKKTSEPLVKLFEGVLNRDEVYDIFHELLDDVLYLNKDIEKMTWSRKIVATSIKQLIKTPEAHSITTPEQIKQYVLNNINKIAQNAILNLEERLLYKLKQDLIDFKDHNDNYNEEIYIKIENQLKSIKGKKLVYILLPFQHYLKNIYNYANNINYGIFNKFFKIKADYDADQKMKDEEDDFIKQLEKWEKEQSSLK